MNIDINKLRPTQRKMYLTLKNSPYFWKIIDDARERINRQLVDLSEMDKKPQKFLLLNDEAKKIIKDLYLSDIWLNNVIRCIETKNLEPQTLNAQLLMDINPNTGRYDLKIRVFRNTGIEDIEFIWKTVEKFQKKYLAERRAIDVGEQGLNIVQWFNEGKTARWIVSQDGGNLYPLSEARIYKINKTYRKILGLDKI